jgi:NAD(P)-dependent dehydrogenase (short-subunit alcohol dehydrogenase family)
MSVDSEISPMAVAIVTGAGRERGIGRVIAERLSADGYGVIVHERSRDRAALTAGEQSSGWRGAASVVDLIQSRGGSAQVVSGDVTDRSTAERLVEAAQSLGAPALLVNNHGTAGEANAHLAHTAPDDVWDETLAVNLTSLHRLSSVVVPALIDSAANNRCVIHFSSTAGHRALARYGAYCASKAAVEQLTRQQAIELARWGIRVNCVAPGLTPTDMIDGTLERAAEAARTDVSTIWDASLKRIPLRRFASTTDIANAVAFLAGDQGAYITGQILTVDGGMTLV